MNASSDTTPTTSSTNRDSDKIATSRHVRVAVVQLAFHPAFKDCLTDPLFMSEKAAPSLLPEGEQATRGPVGEKFKELRKRVRAAYADQLRRRVEAIVRACAAWNVDVLVFPEYAIPSEILAPLALAASNMVVVAGSHYVDRQTIESRIYETLGGDHDPELLTQSASPILYNGKLLALVRKIHATKAEIADLRTGKEWAPVDLPMEIPGPMGVLICLDFMSRESAPHLDHIARSLGNCRFLAAPALTPTHSLDEFNAQATKDARREHRPVLFANYAQYGGSTIHADEGRRIDSRLFPEHAGCLDPGEEGVIVADIDLGFDPAGASTPYVVTRPIIPFAAASLVYSGAERPYVSWLDELRKRLDAPDKLDFHKLVDVTAYVHAQPPPVPSAQSARKRRLERLLQDIDDESSIARVEQFTREIVLTEDILPLPTLRGALARGAADEILRWVNELGAGNFGPVVVRLHDAWHNAERSIAGWSEGAKIAASEVSAAVRGGSPLPGQKGLIRLVEVYEAEVDSRFEDDNRRASRCFDEGHYAEARELYRGMLKRAQEMIAHDEANSRTTLRQWAARCELNIAAATLNLQESEAAREMLLAIDATKLPPKARLNLAESFALVGERERARTILPVEQDLRESERLRLSEVRQTFALLDGNIPDDLGPAPVLRLRAAWVLLAKHDLAGAAEYALEAMQRSDKHDALTIAFATQALTSALRDTIFEDPPNALFIPIDRRGIVVGALETSFDDLKTRRLPVPVEKDLDRAEKVFRAGTEDAEWMAARLVSLDEGEGDSQSVSDARRGSLRLLEQGRPEDAILALPPSNHPWHRRLERVEYFAHGGQRATALVEVLDLIRDVPGRAPIEYMTAELLASFGRAAEALRYAEEAFSHLPGRGYRLLLANQRLSNDNAEGAWELVRGLDHDERPRTLRTRALAAEATNRLDDAQQSWRKYVEWRPKDGFARVRFAQLLYRVRRPEEAATVAWRAFQEQSDRLDGDTLYWCGTLQRLSGPPDAEQTRRIKEIVARLRERFPGDARVEAQRLQLLTMLGKVDESIDFDKLIEGGFALKGESVSGLIDFLKERRTFLDAVGHFARRGAIPTTTACELSNTPLALLVTRILGERRPAVGLLCPPVSLIDQLPTLHLEGATILVSDLELLLLDTLAVLPALRLSLGATGRLVLFRHVYDRILADAANLKISARGGRLEGLAALLRRLETVSVLAAAPGAPNDEAAAARIAGAALVAKEAPTDSGHVSPLALVQDMYARGHLDAAQKSDAERVFADESQPLSPLPEQIVLSLAVAHGLIESGLLDLLFEAYPGRVLLSHLVMPGLRAERDDLADGLKAAKVADNMHARATEGLEQGWIQIAPDHSVNDLPPPRAPENDATSSLVWEPLREMLAYRYVILENPTWWRLTAEFYGSSSLGAPELVRDLAWKNGDDYLVIVRKLRQAARRDLTLPALVRHLQSDPSKADHVLRQLADLGFPDALGAAEIGRIERRYTGLDKAKPSRWLDRQEWMARESGHLGRDLAGMRLATTYARTVFQTFCAEDGDSATKRSTLEKESIVRTLLGRQETIGSLSATPTLDETLNTIAILTIDNRRMLWHRTATDTFILNEQGAAAHLWKALAEWAGQDGSRRAAYGRAVRDAWLALDDRPRGPDLADSATLGMAHQFVPADGNIVSLMDPETESLAILSANWNVKLLSSQGVTVQAPGEPEPAQMDHERILAHGTTLLPSEVDSGADERVFEYLVPVSAQPGGLRIQAPIDAIFLRSTAEARGRLAKQLGSLQGRHDGELYHLLEKIRSAPDDVGLLRQYARRATSTLFRAVRDEPAFLRAWGQARGFGKKDELAGVDELRRILSEPKEPLGDASLRGILIKRLEEKDGVWAKRDDAGGLFLVASEIPGTLPAAPLSWWLDTDDHDEHVRISLYRLDLVDEYPIARIVGDVIFLRLAASRRPRVRLHEAETDLREILPARLDRLLERVSAPAPVDTMAAAEAPLLRICGEVVQRLASPSVLPVREELWLTYRLFQWFCLQLDALSPDARREGIRRLIFGAPRPSPGRDVLDPSGFGRDLFDHRLAAILHALSSMEELVKAFQIQRPAEEAPTPRSASSPMLEEKLLTFARLVQPNPDLASRLDWDAPGNVPDLALDALLQLSSGRFADLGPEARIRRFKSLPDDPEQVDKTAIHFLSRIVTSAADIAAKLTPEERMVLEDKLRTMVDGPTTRLWQWGVFIGFFESGADHLEQDAQRLTIEHADHVYAPAAVGRFLLGLARRDPLLVEEALHRILAATSERGTNVVVGLAVGSLARLLVHGAPSGQEVARRLLVQLAEREPFRADPRMNEVIGFFQLREQQT